MVVAILQKMHMYILETNCKQLRVAKLGIDH